jgi:hypothetical protein|tara:strand:+ start:870 stop:1262 length:393 start_codon:yes stop_codon:yes gene_type:complete
MSGYELKHYLKSLNETKENLLESDDPMWEKKYSPFIINKCLAPFNDTIMLVNEMNMRHHLPSKLQYDFLLNTIRSKKRYAPWVKGDKLKDLEYVKEYFGYSNEKAKAALKLLDNEQINTIKDSLNKGGRK